jgi:hypothetical protein
LAYTVVIGSVALSTFFVWFRFLVKLRIVRVTHVEDCKSIYIPRFIPRYDTDSNRSDPDRLGAYCCLMGIIAY